MYKFISGGKKDLEVTVGCENGDQKLMTDAFPGLTRKRNTAGNVQELRGLDEGRCARRCTGSITKLSQCAVKSIGQIIVPETSESHYENAEKLRRLRSKISGIWQFHTASEAGERLPIR